MKKIFIFAALAATAMTGCSKNADNTAAVSEENAIIMRAVVDKTGASRAAAMTVDRFTSFQVQASKNVAAPVGQDLKFLNSAVFSLDKGTTWQYSPKVYYPTDGNSVSFYAYSPIGDVNMTTAMAQSGATVTFGYTVPADQTTELAEDLLVSSVLGMTTGDVAFTFDHALSAATFAAQNKNVEASELTYVISKIEITKLDNMGTFTYGTSPVPGTWTNSAAANVAYVAPIPESGVALLPAGPAAGGEKALLTTNDFLIILPQLPAWGALPATPGTFVEVTFSLKGGDGSYIYQDKVRQLEIPAGALQTNGFEMGKRYDFTFAFDELNAITMKVDAVNAWTSEVTAL